MYLFLPIIYIIKRLTTDQMWIRIQHSDLDLDNVFNIIFTKKSSKKLFIEGNFYLRKFFIPPVLYIWFT